jgi:hypothetical protein
LNQTNADICRIREEKKDRAAGFLKEIFLNQIFFLKNYPLQNSIRNVQFYIDFATKTMLINHKFNSQKSENLIFLSAFF